MRQRVLTNVLDSTLQRFVWNDELLHFIAGKTCFNPTEIRLKGRPIRE